VKFTLRDLFWLTLVAAVCFASWGALRRQAAQLRSEARIQQWHFEIVAEALKMQTGWKATVREEGVMLEMPDGSKHFYVKPED
jgi:hypothetical protein